MLHRQLRHQPLKKLTESTNDRIFNAIKLHGYHIDY